ncbi:MAG: hypothetical protein MK086_12720 [Flavobacteriales bacterium]|nr:hypothetical protein [Flavobacteriales bacterium]
MITGKIVIGGMAFLMSTALFAQIEEKIEKTFQPIGSDPYLSIKNSFGDIVIKHHSKEIFDVLVEINAVPSKSKNFEKVKGRVRVDIEEKGNKLELRTINELDGISVEELAVDYTIYIPENTTLEIGNQFGDVWIEGTSSKVNARVEHGSFFCGDVKGVESIVKVQFGDLTLGEMKEAKLEIHHGELEADRLTNVELDIMFSDAEIDHASGFLEVYLQHSELSLGKVESGMKRLEVDGQFSDLSLEEGPWEDFMMEIEGSFTDFSMPLDIKSLINYESKGMHSREYRINEKITDKRIIINADHSDVDMD